MQDSRIYDEQGNEIYGGRGARSKKCREMISDGLAYRMNGEETLVCMQVETPAEATVSESAGSLREVAAAPNAIHGTRIFVFRRCHLHYAFTNARNFWIRWLPVSAT